MAPDVTRTWRFLALLAMVTVATAPFTRAQQPSSSQPASSTPQAASRIFSQKDLDELLAPVALYPDALLAQVFMAATYPLEVVQAARWQKQNPGLKEAQLEQALQQQAWDPAVKSLTAVPQVLTMMNEKLEWTTKLGDAVLAQQDDVLKTVQSLRRKADEAGNLKSSEKMLVRKDTENSVQVIKIESPKPDVVYVPTYDPATVYGPWWYPYPPPYYYYPPGYGYGYYPGLAFATGVFVGAAIWGNLTWGGGNNNINIDVDRFNNFNKSNISNKNWGHNVEHRKGANYRDSATAQKFNRGGDRQAAAAREQFRGRADQGRSQLSQMDRGQLNRSVGNAGNRSFGDRSAGGGNRTPSQGARSAGVGDRGSGASRGGNSYGGGASQRSSSSGFSGSHGGGASTRAASSRGGASRGGGGGRGGGRR